MFAEDPIGAPEDPWALAEPEPSGFVMLWPDDEPPTPTEIIAALEGQVESSLVTIDEDLETDEDAGIVWSRVVEGEALAAPLVIWVEPAQPGGAVELEDPTADAARWVVGFEAVLDPSDPLSEYVDIVRLVAAALPDAIALLDLNSVTWYRRRELEELFLSQVEPPAEILWTIHVVRSGDTGQVWLHTHGLWRCGQPELEMLDVPQQRMSSATGLLNDIASLILEHPGAPPGEPFQIGSGLAVTLQPWETVAATVASGQPGSIEDRERPGMEAHVGHRAVVCALDPSGAVAPVWIWPEEVLDQIEGDTAVVYRTHRATERQGALARSTWDQLATAFASSHALRDADAGREDGRRRIVFLVKAGFAQRPEAEVGSSMCREHLWFEVHRFEAAAVEGELVNQPLEVDGMRKGDVIRVDRARLSDWSVMTPVGIFGPSSIAAVWRAIDALKAELTNGTAG